MRSEIGRPASRRTLNLKNKNRNSQTESFVKVPLPRPGADLEGVPPAERAVRVATAPCLSWSPQTPTPFSPVRPAVLRIVLSGVAGGLLECREQGPRSGAWLALLAGGPHVGGWVPQLD